MKKKTIENIEKITTFIEDNKEEMTPVIMTREQFNNYKFSMRTQVKLHGEWHLITEVDFEKHKIRNTQGYYLDFSEFEDIRD